MTDVQLRTEKLRKCAPMTVPAVVAAQKIPLFYYFFGTVVSMVHITKIASGLYNGGYDNCLIL